MTYKIIYGPFGDPCIVREDGASIPNDSGNRDFNDFFEWNATLSTPLDYTTKQVVVIPNPRIQQIKDVLAANDIKIVRALTEGDTTRIAEHIAAQAALRTELQGL